MRRQGYLVLELLAVVALVALLLSAVVPAVFARGESGTRSERRAAVSRLRSIDAGARALGVQRGPVWLRVGEGGRLGVWSGGLTERLTGQGRGDPGCVLIDGASGRELGGVRFDRLGRTPEYLVRIGGGPEPVVVRFGAFGVVEEVEP